MPGKLGSRSYFAEMEAKVEKIAEILQAFALHPEEAAKIVTIVESHADLLEVARLAADASLGCTGEDEERRPVLKRLRTLAYLAIAKAEGVR